MLSTLIHTLIIARLGLALFFPVVLLSLAVLILQIRRDWQDHSKDSTLEAESLD